MRDRLGRSCPDPIGGQALGGGELVVKLLWLIGKPCANRLVGEFFSDELAPWERSLIDRSDGFFRR